MYRCPKPKCRKRVWTSIAVASQIQVYDRETVTWHNHEGEPTRMEILLIIDRALNLATSKDVINSCRLGRSIR
uniref:Uncharacterized protein n=1 Tax=Ditylenchus dipsaci TaxID=166011 RepID=A0A915D096_9BILA